MRAQPKLILAFVQMCLSAPTLSRAFQLQSSAYVASWKPVNLCGQSPSGFQCRPRIAKNIASHLRTASKISHRTSLCAAESMGFTGDDMLRTAVLQLHKFAGLMWLLLFEGAVGVVLKFCGISLPPSVCTRTLPCNLGCSLYHPACNVDCCFSHPSARI